MHNLAVQPAPVYEDGEQPVIFTATGSEYFRIWIVNLLLTIVTFGIYSAWAKVRRTQYFYASTELAGSSFEYHGNPKAILKGRILAAVLFGAYNVATKASVTAGVIAFLVFAALMPLIMWKSMQFKLHNTSYRGIRFGFNGSALEAYAYFLLLPMLFGTGLLAPLAHHRIKRFQVTESRYGSRQFGFDAPVSGFYAIWIGMALIFAAGLLALSWLGGKVAGEGQAGMAVVLTTAAGLLFWGLLPVAFCALQNLIWSHISIGEHQMRCNMKTRTLLWIYATNLLGMLLTLGLYTPFAKVRAMKYRLESMSLVVNGSLDGFVAAEAEHQNAAGEGMADVFDMDLSL